MRDPVSVIQTLSQSHLESVAAAPTKPGLILVGSEDSMFLKSVHKLAAQVGVDSIILPCYPPLIQDCKVVIDHETAPHVQHIPMEADVDNLYHPGTSCVSDAAFELLDELLPLYGKTVTIVGRGHAVKGLAQRLIDASATVTVAHSATKELYSTMRGQDIVVLATPTVSAFPLANDLVLDIGGSMPQEWVQQLPPGCQYTKRIGKLTNSILLHRVVRR